MDDNSKRVAETVAHGASWLRHVGQTDAADLFEALAARLAEVERSLDARTKTLETFQAANRNNLALQREATARAEAAEARVATLEASLSGGVLTKNDSLGLLQNLATAEAEAARLAAELAEARSVQGAALLSAPVYFYHSDVTGKPEPIPFYEFIEIEVDDAVRLGVLPAGTTDWPRCSFDRNDAINEARLRAVTNALRSLTTEGPK